MRDRRPLRRLLTALLAVAAAAPAVAGCARGGGDGTVRWFVFAEPSGAYQRIADSCTARSGGRWRIAVETLPTDSDTQRLLLVRRLVARDPAVDVIGLDVVWTAEFAEAGWLRDWESRRAEVTAGVLAGPLATATYSGRLWAAPFTSNTQLLWYRRSRVPRPPSTWDELVALAERLPPAERAVLVSGAATEGLTVWFNSLLRSAGGSLVEDADDPAAARPGLAAEPTRRALAVMRRLATSPAADPSLAVATSDDIRLAFQGGAPTFMVNYPVVYPSARMDAPEVFRDLAWAPYPAVGPGPARPPLGGVNLGVSAFSRQPDLAFAAAECLRGPTNQRLAAIRGGLPPTVAAVYDDPAVRAQYPFGALLRNAIAAAAPRPATPAYHDVSLAVRRTLHPPSTVDPDRSGAALREPVARALRSQALL